MRIDLDRRQFVQLTVGGALGCAACGSISALAAAQPARRLVSPGCRRSKVKVGRVYMGDPKSGYPHPGLDCEAEKRRYEAEFAKLQDQLHDVDFVGDVLVSSPDQLAGVKDALRGADGILAVQFTGDVLPAIREVAALGRPTMFFAAPYSGHEWNALSAMRRRETGQNIDAVLTSDFGQLAAAVRPFRAIHHLREAKILNLSTTKWTPDVDPAAPGDYAEQLQRKFGTEIKPLALQRMLAVYDSISDQDAQAETDRWIAGATAVVEPTRDDVFKSCKLALAFEKILDEEDATSIAVDCYESMWRKLPAYPCIPFSYLNNLGLGGICQSDLQCAMVHTMLQGFTGRPGFIGNSMFDFAKNAVVLVHCTCTTKMDGPDKPAMPYKLRGVAERKEGACPQVQMRIGQKVTCSILTGTTAVRYFTGQIVETPDVNRACRNKIVVKVDGGAEKMWQNWRCDDIHRVTCYGDLTHELSRFCRFMKLNLIDEADPKSA